MQAVPTAEVGLLSQVKDWKKYLLNSTERKPTSAKSTRRRKVSKVRLEGAELRCASEEDCGVDL